MKLQRGEKASERAWRLLPRVVLLCLMLPFAERLLHRSTWTREPDPPPPAPEGAASPPMAARPAPPPPQVDAALEDAAPEREPDLPPDEAMPDRRTTREVLVGRITPSARRITWQLSRGEGVSRLDVLCQTSEAPRPSPGMVLNGEEYDEARWEPPIRTTYVGAPSENALDHHFTRARAPASRGRCPVLPRDLVLACRPDKVPVRPAFVRLVVGGLIPGKDNMLASWWKPGAQTIVSVLSCEASEARRPDEEGTGSRLNHLAPLAFVPGTAGAPAIEWAFQNDDAALQEGTYRWIPAR